MDNSHTPYAVEMQDITKRFPGVLANESVDLHLGRGEVLALLGENGAGKSTLVNVLAGLYQPDRGQVLVHGQPVQFRSPADAIAIGIGIVHQHFMLAESLTVAENVILGLESASTILHLDQVGDLKTTLSTLEMELTSLRKIPTWPWEPETLRWLIGALVLPLGIWLIQYVFQRFLTP